MLKRILNKIGRIIRKRMYRRICTGEANIRKEHVLVVKADGIGDWLLARNGIRELRSSSKYRHQHFTLLGNIVWKELAEAYDSDCFQEFIWINPSIVADFGSYDSPRLELLRKIRSNGYETIIQPVHSRVTGIDRLIADSGAIHRITSSGDTINSPEVEKLQSDHLYTLLIPVPDPSSFEFFRNDHFFSSLIQTETGKTPLLLATRTKESNPKHIIIAPGAGHAFRRWPAKNFAMLIQLLQQKDESLTFNICGSNGDAVIADEIVQRAPGCKIKVLCGQLSLDAFAETVASAGLLIGNDSGSIHLAAATNTPAVCISNGNMFGRFHPYPVSMQKSIVTIYPDPAFSDLAQREVLINKTRIRSDYHIDAVEVLSVVPSCLRLLGL